MSFVDDIQLIDGIGDKSTEALKEAGVATLTAFVALSDEERDKLLGDLGFAEQAEKQEWLVQAQEMIDGKPPRAKVDQELAKKLAKQASEKSGESE